MMSDKVREVRKYILDIKLLQEIKAMLIDRQDGVSGGIHTMMGSTGKPTDKAGQVIANLEELNHQLDKEIAEYTALVDEVIWAINRLPESQHKVIVYRYIKGISWNEIAQTLNYAESYCYELNRKALKYLDNHS